MLTGKGLVSEIHVIVRQRNSIFLVDLDLRCIENVLTDYDSQNLQKQEST